MSASKKYSLAVVASVVAFAVANLAHYLRPVWCFDCFFPYGVPFTFYRLGGFAGGGGVVWYGLIADVVCALAVGLFAGAAWNQVATSSKRG